jgi:phospholipid/cholesterol/gamma-HCH transport system permease protein
MAVPSTQSNDGAKSDTTASDVPWLAAPLSIWTGLLSFLGEVAILSGRTFRSMFRGVDVRDLLNQMALIGADSIWIVLVITSATGAVFALYTTNLALKIGFTQFVGGTMSYGFLNELGPLLGGIAFASRSGAAIAAEIGSMAVTEQLDALRSMAVSPIRYLVVPRVLAAIIMLPLLTAIADVAGIYGGYLFAMLKGVPSESFWESVRTYTISQDLFNGLLKSVVFGFLVGIVSCQQGLRTSGGATGVGRATTSSVVLCVLLIFVADFFLAQLLTARDNGRQASLRSPQRTYVAVAGFDPGLAGRSYPDNQHIAGNGVVVAYALARQ